MPYRDDTGARAALEDSRKRRSLPLLERIEVASPCAAGWDDMMRTADERIRACGACNKHVYDLSNMTAREAERLILERDGVACVRYFERKDGTILLADCTVGRRRKAATTLAAAGVITALAGAAMGYVLTREPEAPIDDITMFETETMVVGQMRVDPDEPDPDDQPADSPAPSVNSSAR